MEFKRDYILWDNLTFKTTSYRKNFDLSYLDENFITEHEGTISEIRLNDKKAPFHVGEFQFSVWNIKFAKEFDIELLKNMKEHTFENTYEELLSVVDNGDIELNNVNKLVLLHTFILHPKYRKRGITQEFIEFLYRDYIYGENNMLIALVKPIQENPIDYDYFWNKKKLQIRELLGKDVPYELITARKYYELDELKENVDTEIIEYKLFSVAARCGFKRINESHLFYLTPSFIIKRLKEKRKEFNEL